MNRIVEKDTLILDMDPRQGEKLTLAAKEKDGVVTIAISGPITSACQDEVGDEVLAFLSAGKHVRLNLRQVPYIAPEAVQKLLHIQLNYVDKLNLQMILCGLTPEMTDWFCKYHYAQQFDIDRSEK